MLHQLLYRTVSIAALMAGTLSGARSLASGETQALAFDFTDNTWLATTNHYGSAYVLDTGTPANNYDSHPYGLLTYTSPSAKMTMGPSASMRFQAHNLCLQSEALSTSPWTSINSTLSSTGFLENATNAPHGVYQSVTAVNGAEYALTFEVSGVNRTWCVVDLEDSSNRRTWFDLSGSGAVGTNAAGTTASITALGDGYYRCTIQRIVSASTVYPQVLSATADNVFSFAGNTSNGIAVRKAHLRRTPSDSTYLATTSAARYALPFEWDSGGSLLGLLVEEARTNLCLYSDDLTNAAWTKSNLTTAKTATGPDGVANSATTITATAANATALQSITSGSAARVTSVWLKRRTGSGNIDITQDNGSTWTTKTITSSWARYDIGPNTAANPTVGIRVVTSGDAVDVALFQHEVGSFPTSAMPTLGVTVTRAVDDIRVSKSAFPFSADPLTLFAKGKTPTVNTYSTLLSIKGGAYELRREYNSTDGGLIANAAFAIATRGGSGSWATGLKIAGAYATNDAACVVAAGTVATSSSAFDYTGGSTYVGIGQRIGPSDMFNGHIEKIMILPRRMSNAELQALTT